MKSPIVWILFALAVPAFSQSPSPSGTDEATAAITHLREGLVTSFSKGDIDGLLAYLDPDVVVTWQNGEVCRGPEAIRAFYARMMTGDKRVVRQIKSEPEVLGRHVYGGWAVSWGNLHDHFVLTDGSDLPFNSVFTATIAKRGDRWLLTAFHTSVSAFENPVLTVATRKTAIWTGLGGGAAGLLLGLIGARLLTRKKRPS
jgi:ketosteroid isomerase-like protein